MDDINYFSIIIVIIRIKDLSAQNCLRFSLDYPSSVLQ